MRLVVSACAAGVLVLSGCADPEPEMVQVAYQADFHAEPAETVGLPWYAAGGQGDVTYTSTGGGVSQQAGVDVPFKAGDGSDSLRQTLEVGSPVVFSVQSTRTFGSITCRIVGSGGQVISEATSYGAYGVASCSGVVE